MSGPVDFAINMVLNMFLVSLTTFLRILEYSLQQLYERYSFPFLNTVIIFIIDDILMSFVVLLLDWLFYLNVINLFKQHFSLWLSFNFCWSLSIINNNLQKPCCCSVSDHHHTFFLYQFQHSIFGDKCCNWPECQPCS